MNLFSTCISAWWLNIDWATTGNWISALGTCTAAIVGFIALNTWSKQIKQQERYQKADLLICSYTCLLKTGYDMLFSCINGGEIRLNDHQSKEYSEWLKALAQYRIDYQLAHILFSGDEASNQIDPELIQSKVLGAYTYLHDMILFESKMECIKNEGIAQIQRKKWRKE